MVSLFSIFAPNRAHGDLMRDPARDHASNELAIAPRIGARYGCMHESAIVEIMAVAFGG